MACGERLVAGNAHLATLALWPARCTSRYTRETSRAAMTGVIKGGRHGGPDRTRARRPSLGETQELRRCMLKGPKSLTGVTGGIKGGRHGGPD